jgi:membrane-bound lytic murein transglycosylase D
VARPSTPGWRKSLTGEDAATYHLRMSLRRQIPGRAVRCVSVLALVWLAWGCEEAAKKSAAKAPVPQQSTIRAAGAESEAASQAPSQAPKTPAPAKNPPKKLELASLPVFPRGRLLALLPPEAGRSSKDELIARVERRFASGEQNYKAGHLEAARKDFDQAVDWLLESGYDLSSDAKLGELFHRIVDTVYADELQAFRAGDGFQEAPAVPAPIDEVAEMTFPVDPRLKERAEEAAMNLSHDLPLTVNDQVLGFLNFFQTPRGRTIVETGLRRAGRYREMISRVLQEEGMPQDLIYLAQAESAFQPLALSRAGARGIWQFVPWRGNEYGLRHTWWVDERQDPEKATRAAARHLRDLYGMYGDWYLAMAAYNCGPGNVQKGIERTGYADFWELYKRNVLPRETRNYVPIIVALTLIAKDAAHYGIAVEPEMPVATDMVKPGRAIDLRLVAETIDVDVETLRSLNPSLLRLATPDDPNFELHLPSGTAARFSAEIADIPADKWVSWRRHRVEAGETLTSIGKKYHVTSVAIAAANNLEKGAALEPGEKLIIPAVAPASETQRRLVSYRVRRGDTLPGIADRYSVSSEDVRKWNRLRSNRVSRGMVLRIYTLGGAPEATGVRARAKSKKAARPATNVAQASPKPAPSN